MLSLGGPLLACGPIIGHFSLHTTFKPRLKQDAKSARDRAGVCSRLRSGVLQNPGATTTGSEIAERGGFSREAQI